MARRFTRPFALRFKPALANGVDGHGFAQRERVVIRAVVEADVAALGHDVAADHAGLGVVSCRVV
jgi:hypothetical protein